MEECESYSYTPSTSICFCVTRPKLREIFAANFRDRIVQHWICMRIEPLFERRYAAMGDVTWNCRKGKGVRLAVNALRRDILEVSCNYMGFFIDKATYALRRKAVSRYCPRLFDYYIVKGHFEVFKVKSKYTISNLLLKQDV